MVEMLSKLEEDKVRALLELVPRLNEIGQTVPDKIVGPEQAGLRFRVLTEEFLLRLAAELSESLATDIAVSLQGERGWRAIPGTKEGFGDGSEVGQVINEEIGAVVIRLRVLQSSLLICLPLELALELSGRVVDEEPRIFLQPLSSEDTTALAFLVARFLAKAPLCHMERVYLTSLDFCRGEEAQRVSSEFVESLNGKNGQTLFITCKIQGASFPVLALLSACFLNRVCYYARLRIGPKYRPVWLPELTTNWKLNLRLELKSLSSLMALKPGEFIGLNSTDEEQVNQEYAGIEAELVQEGRHLGQQRARIGVKAKVSSSQTHLQLEVIDDESGR